MYVCMHVCIHMYVQVCIYCYHFLVNAVGANGWYSIPTSCTIVSIQHVVVVLVICFVIGSFHILCHIVSSSDITQFSLLCCTMFSHITPDTLIFCMHDMMLISL